MDASQIWRFPKKYAELFKNISNEDTGIIIKELFLGDGNNLQGLNKAYYDIIKVDLDNLEKSAINGKKGGRPKTNNTEITPGYENEKPQVIQNDNLKEREREREREREDSEKLYEKFTKTFTKKRNNKKLAIERIKKVLEIYNTKQIENAINTYYQDKKQTISKGEWNFIKTADTFFGYEKGTKVLFIHKYITEVKEKPVVNETDELSSGYLDYDFNI